MAWFTRRRDDQTDAGQADAGRRATVSAAAAAQPSADSGDDEGFVVPKVRGIPEAEQQRIQRLLGEVRDAGVDVDDLQAIGRAYDDWLAGWLAQRDSKREDHQVLVDRLGVAIGEHLVRHTDVEWGMVTDAFGTDLGVAAAADDFTVVPMNLVAVRWLNRTSGWVPGVVGHLVNLRTTMR